MAIKQVEKSLQIVKGSSCYDVYATVQTLIFRAWVTCGRVKEFHKVHNVI